MEVLDGDRHVVLVGQQRLIDQRHLSRADAGQQTQIGRVAIEQADQGLQVRSQTRFVDHNAFHGAKGSSEFRTDPSCVWGYRRRQGGCGKAASESKVASTNGRSS